MSIENAAYLLKYDSVYGIYDKDVAAAGNVLKVDNKEILYLSEKDPLKLPWKIIRSILL
jgi:glyceraldehyde 3-phosphate dehydrogenase